MCGISGILSFNNVDRTNRLNKIHSLIHHRGKDASGIVARNNNLFSDDIYFAHRRLSILDLSESSNQPLIDYQNKNMIIFNGEIYNYKEIRHNLKKLNYNFITNSDTEVLLYSYNEWGIDFIKILKGMFSIAIWDEKIKTLYCVRDEFGVKPLYYKINGQSIEFASESKALYEKEELDPFYIQSYFLGMYSPFGTSVFKKIQSLKPGHFLKINDKKIKIEKYFDLHEEYIKRKKPKYEDFQKINRLFNNSVKSQLISDRNVSLSLSSGNDSTSIFYSMLKNNTKFNTISIGYEKSDNYDLKQAQKISKDHGIKNYNQIISNSESFDLISKSIQALSEPVGDSSIVSTFKLSQIASSLNSPVLLSGVGGDEVFVGYDRYKGKSSLPRYILNKTPKILNNLISKFFSETDFNKFRLKNRFFDNFLSSGGSKKLFLKNNSITLNNYFNTFISFIDESAIKELKGNYEFLLFDLSSYLPNLLLSFYDQITMSNTVEGRVPFIDKELIRYSHQFDFKYHADFNKVRKIFKKSNINEKFSNKKKMGFSGPIKNWVEYNYKKFKEQIIYSDFNPYINKNEIENIFKQHEIYQNNHNEIYILFVLCIWKESINVS